MPLKTTPARVKGTVPFDTLNGDFVVKRTVPIGSGANRRMKIHQQREANALSAILSLNSKNE